MPLEIYAHGLEPFGCLACNAKSELRRINASALSCLPCSHSHYLMIADLPLLDVRSSPAKHTVVHGQQDKNTQQGTVRLLRTMVVLRLIFGLPAMKSEVFCLP